MSEKLLIFPRFTVNHPPPVNLIEKDKWVFQDFFTQAIPEFHYARLSKARVYFKHITKHGQILKEYCSSHPVPLRDRLLIPFKRVGYKKKKLAFALSLVTLFGDNFHHFLAEVVPLIIYGQKIFGESVPMLIPAYYFKQPYIEPYLRILKVNWVTFESREQVLVSELIVFTNLSIAHFNPQILAQIQNQLAPNPASIPWRKVFVSRSKARFRKVIEEEMYHPILKEKGFEILCLEDYGVEDQIRIFSETKFLVGIHGAGLTNMVFMPKGGKVLELRAITTETHVYNIFYVMASACGHDYFYALGEGTHPSNKLSDVNVDLDKFSIQLEKMLHTDGNA